MPCPKARLLIVDDKPSIREMMSLVLAEIGYQVRCAQEGFSALRELRIEIPDILLSDLNMPGMSGFELLRVVRHRFPAIQVIAMSGSFSGNEVPSGVAADAFYQKGSSMGALLQIIEALPHIKERVPLSTGIAPPLQIRRNRKDASADASVRIDCPGCLRTFSQPLDGSGGREREANCIYCGNSFRYSAAEPLNRMPQRASRQRAGTAISAQGASAVGD